VNGFAARIELYSDAGILEQPVAAFRVRSM
jgi:hypothetical protein